MSQGTDTNLFIWTIAWDVHAFVHQPLSIFDANIFYPFRHTLAFSENLIGSAALAAPVLWLTGNPVLAMNLAAIVTVPLCALGAFVLARRLGASAWAAAIAGLVYGFSAPRFLRIDQLHLTSVEWIPFSLAYAHDYVERRRPRDLRIAIGFFVLQALTSGHAAVFLAVALILLAAYVIAMGEPIAFVGRLRDVGATGALLLVPAILVALPYRSVQVEMGLRRTLENWHTPWTSFLAAPTHVDSWLVERLLPGVDVFGTAGAYLFPGVLTLVLAAIGIVWRNERGIGWRRAAVALDLVFLVELAAALFGTFARDPRLRVEGVVVASARHPWQLWVLCAVAGAGRIAIAPRLPLATPLRVGRRDAALFYTLLLLLCLWLSIGPPFGLWQYVYWLPGFDFIRAPSRFTIPGVLALAVLAAFGFDALTHRDSRTRPVAGMIAGALMAIEFLAPLPMSRQAPTLPAIDRWLASQTAPFVVAEVPVPDTANITIREEQESIYILHSMAHWQKTVHGYSGLLPEYSDELYWKLSRFPDAESIGALRAAGVTRIVVHDRVLASRAAASPVLALEHAESDGAVFVLSTR